MTHLSAGAEELWAWLYQPLQELKVDQEGTWEERRIRFLDRLGVSDSSAHPVTEMLMARLDELTDEQRAEVLTGEKLDALAYSVVEESTPTSQDPDSAGPAYDEQTWHDYLRNHLSRWDGMDESWPQFAEWFTYYAAEAGVGQPARELVAYLQPMDNGTRLATVAQYGVVITPHPEASAEDEGADDAGTEDDVELDEFGEELMAEILAEHPELADLPEATRRRLLADVIGEESASAE
jgi:hypothetical protein